MSADTPYAESLAESAPSHGSEPVATPLWRRIAKTVILGLFFLLCLSFFTVLKLPEEKLREAALGAINGQLASRGMVVSAERGSLSFGLGFTYTLENVALNSPSAPTVKWDRIAVSPSLLPMVLGRYGGTFALIQGSSELSGEGSLSPGAASTPFSVSFEAKKADLGRLGLLPLLAGIQASLPLTGSGSFSGDLNALSGLTGNAKVDLNNLTIEAQSLHGFALPKLMISSGQIDIQAEKGKLALKTFRLGKAGNPSDDLSGSLTGDISLGKTLPASALNLKATFGLSENVKKIPGMSLIEGFLTNYRQGDGSYVYPISGRLDQLMPM